MSPERGVHPEGIDIDTLHRQQMSSANAVLALCLVMMQANSARQVVRLTASAVPTIADCRTAAVLHPEGAGAYYEQAPPELRSQLSKLPASGGQLQVGAHGWSWAYPMGVAGHDRLFLVVAGPDPRPEDQFLLSVIAQVSGTVISKLESIEKEHTAASKLAAVNAELEDTVQSLRKLMETHRQLNAVAASSRGERGIAEVLHQLTRYPVAIEDIYGNVQASAGPIPPKLIAKDSSEAREALVRRLAGELRPVYRGISWLVLASPRSDIRGVIRLVDEGRAATESDLAALQYAATVLSMELARIQSLAEADLRTHRDFAEELLAGADTASAKATARALRYDVERPHRVVIATAATGRRPSRDFYDVVARQVRRLDVGSLVVSRSDSVIVVATRDVDWHGLCESIAHGLAEGHCRLAVGARYPTAWQTSASFEEAQFAARLAEFSHSRAPVTEFESLGVYRLLSSVTDLAGVEQFMRTQLGPILDYDQKHGTTLMETLAIYLDANCNYETAATALCVHKGTVKYRLNRIREITGRDLGDGSTRLDLHLATRVWTTLRAMTSEAAG